MNGSILLPSIDILKVQAKRLRAQLQVSGTTIGHSRSLELLAHQHGYKDWNTLIAAVGNRPPPSPVAVGQKVSGAYLGHPFTGEVIGVQARLQSQSYRITMAFDEPVNVSKFEAFTVFRRRVSCTIDRHGRTAEKTSDGQPHVVLNL